MTDPLTTPTPEPEQDPIAALRKELEELKARRAGEASSFTKKEEGWKKEQEGLLSRIQALETLPVKLQQALGVSPEPDTKVDPLSLVQSKVDELNARLAEMEKERQEALRAARLAEAESRKVNMLAAKNPALTSFAQFVPTRVDEGEQGKLVDGFVAALENFKNATVVKAPASPPPTPGAGTPGAPNLALLEKAYFEAIASGDNATIEKASQAYYAAVAKG